MATKKDIIEVLGLISMAYPNFKMVQAGEMSTADAYLAFLGDLPADLLKSAVLQTCAESGRAFAPSVGEIRGAASVLMAQSQGVPSTLEAWDEVVNRAYYNNITPSHPLYSGGEIYTSDPNPYQWSHPLVERVAFMMGFPQFPNGENTGVDRAHFFKQYEAELNRYMSDGMQLPDVKQYIEESSNSQIKQLSKGMTK